MLMMSHITGAHRKFISEFIKMYRSFPTLWDVKSLEYNNRDDKRAAYLKLVAKLREIEPAAQKQDVIRKINSLRSAFRREYKKVTALRAMGKYYKPRLWYYNLIFFTVRGIDQRRSKALELVTVNTTEVTDSLSMDDSEAYLYKEEEDDSFVEEDWSLEAACSTSRSNASETSRSRSFQKCEDEYDAIGYNVAAKLRNMDKNQRIIAERIISETLFQGQVGALAVTSSYLSFHPVLPAVNSQNIKIDPLT